MTDKKQWSGMHDGLPPVGTEVEFVKIGSAEEKWWKGVVIGYDDNAIVVKMESGRYGRKCRTEYKIRPVTKEKTKREIEVDRISKLIVSRYPALSVCTAFNIAEMLYANGYRNVILYHAEFTNEQGETEKLSINAGDLTLIGSFKPCAIDLNCKQVQKPPEKFWVGQRVIVDGEIGIVTTPSNPNMPNTKDRLWVHKPSVGYPSQYDVKNIKPLPHGQL